MRNTVIALGALSLFLLAGLAPLAIAEKDGRDRNETSKQAEEHREAQEEAREQQEEAKEHREAAKERADEEERDHRHWVPARFSLDLSGSGTSARGNQTYSFALNGTGQGAERRHLGNETVLRSRIHAHATVKDANGTVVKDGDLNLNVMAHRHGNGTWTWSLESAGQRAGGMPRLVLHGDAVKESDGHFALTAKGHATFRAEGSDRSTNVKLTAAGHLVRLPPATAHVSLTGTGTDRDNRTYTVTATGDGPGMEKIRNGTVVRFEGKLALHLVVKDANGTVVKERDIRARLSAEHLGGNATWLVQTRHGDGDHDADDVPRLMLHGHATADGGAYDLTGKGRSVFWNDDDGKLAIKLSVQGSMTLTPAPSA